MSDQQRDAEEVHFDCLDCKESVPASQAVLCWGDWLCCRCAAVWHEADQKTTKEYQ